MSDLIPWPFPLPEGFVDQLGYARTVEAFDSPVMRARLAEVLRRQGLAEPQPMPTGPRPFVALYWEPAGDELAFTDGVHSGAGQLQHWLWLDYLHGRAPGQGVTPRADPAHLEWHRLRRALPGPSGVHLAGVAVPLPRGRTPPPDRGSTDDR